MRSRNAFTLIEMLLTLSMCVVLMALIGGAMNFYVRDMGTAEQSFRQSQVATAVLQMIEDDLRMTITTRPVNTDGLAEVLSAAASPLAAMGIGSQATGGGSSSDSSSPEDPAADDPAADESGSITDDPVPTASLDVAAGGTALASPGLIGNANQLQIDVSRLPRLEATLIDPAMVASVGLLVDRPSDIKTVSYFVQPAGLGLQNDALEKLAISGGLAPSTRSNSLSGGLVRREIDRAIHVQASTTGGISRLQGTGEVIAPEINAIQFEYYDGINWLPMISSDEIGFLPPAVRVSIELAGEQRSDGQPGPTRTFTHVIFLPMSHPEDATITDTSEPSYAPETSDAGI